MGVKLRHTDVMKASSQIRLLNANNDEREAARLKKSLERYEFVLLVVNMSRMISAINITTHLQRKDADLGRPSITYPRIRR